MLAIALVNIEVMQYDILTYQQTFSKGIHIVFFPKEIPRWLIPVVMTEY
jgi:hypothetical protein